MAYSYEILLAKRNPRTIEIYL